MVKFQALEQSRGAIFLEEDFSASLKPNHVGYHLPTAPIYKPTLGQCNFYPSLLNLLVHP